MELIAGKLALRPSVEDATRLPFHPKMCARDQREGFSAPNKSKSGKRCRPEPFLLHVDKGQGPNQNPTAPIKNATKSLDEGEKKTRKTLKVARQRNPVKQYSYTRGQPQKRHHENGLMSEWKLPEEKNNVTPVPRRPRCVLSKRKKIVM